MNRKVKIKDYITGEMLFFAAFISRLIIATWDTTTFPQFGIAHKVALAIVVLCAVVKITFYDTFSLSEILIAAVTGTCALLSTVKSGQNVFFILFILIVAAKGVDLRKIIKVYLAVVGSIVGLAFICSVSGVITHLRFWQPAEMIYRNSYGIVYCTDFAAHVLFLVLAYYYLRGAKLRWFEYVATIVLTAAVYITTKARLDSVCLLITVALFGLGNAITETKKLKKVLKHNWLTFWRFITPLVMPLCVVAMFLLTIYYDPDSAWMSALNKALSKRLSYGNSILLEKGFGLFGQRVTLIGYGGTTIDPGADYNFTDCSYLYILITSGTVILAISILVYMYAAYRNGGDIYILYAIVIISINCTISHHMSDISYIPFVLCVTAAVTGSIRENKEYVGSKIQCYINY